MTRIAVLGANGQVGSEVSLALSLMSGVSVIPVVRSALAGVLLERCGLNPRVATAAEYPGVLADADVVIDTTLPGGLPSQVERGAATNMSAALSAMGADATYVYCSSAMAFGMPPGATRYSEWKLSRTQYAATKRQLERQAAELGRAHGRRVFAFRLGEVHGELQAATRSWSARLREGEGPLLVASHPTDVVFATTIAMALPRLASGGDEPGVYTVVDSPDWQLEDIVRHYVAMLRLARPVVVEQVAGDPSVLQRLASAVKTTVAKRRDLLTSHVLPRRLDIEWQMKARWLRSRVRSELATPTGERFDARMGPVPGPRLGFLHATRPDSLALQSRVRRLLDDRLGPRGHALPLDS